MSLGPDLGQHLSTIKTAAAVAPGNGGVKAAGCLHATTTAFSSVMSIMMIVTLHFVQQPVLDHSGAQVQAARCILILSFYDDDDYTGIDSFIIYH